MSMSGDLFAHGSSYRHLRDEVTSVADGEERYGRTSAREHPSEHLLHLLWQRQELLQQPLKTLDQRILTVYRAGRWTRTLGPDFQAAKLRLD